LSQVAHHSYSKPKLGAELPAAFPVPIPMSDPGGCAVRRPPTAAEVVGRLKDDGDFDALRRAIVRKVKDNVSFPINVNSPHP